MHLLAPRIAPEIGVAMARVAERFYIFSILLVGATIYMQRPAVTEPVRLAALAALAVGAAAFLRLFPWDKYAPRVFTLTHLFTSGIMLSILVYMTGGLQSGYGILFFLIILFSYFYNLAEMFSIATVVSVFYILPHLYDARRAHSSGTSAIMIMFFYLGTYVLYGVTRFVLKKNVILEELNSGLIELYSITSDLTRDMEKEAMIEDLSEKLKDHLPSTYCIMMLLDDKSNMTLRLAIPLRTVSWEPLINAVFGTDRLPLTREALATRQPKVFRLESDEIDDELEKVVSRSTKSILVVPIRIGADDIGALIYGEERSWERAPFSNEKIQLAVAISRQVAVWLNMWWCVERIKSARRELQVSHDKVIKAERLATLGEVTRAVEHEINNPLNVIVNWAEVYREDATIDRELRKKFQIILDMAMRIREVVRKLAEAKDVKSIEFMKGQRMTKID